MLGNDLLAANLVAKGFTERILLNTQLQQQSPIIRSTSGTFYYFYIANNHAELLR